MAGTFATDASMRGLLWGLDGVMLVLAAVLLAVHHFRQGNDVVAGGFFVFAIGQALVLSSAAMPLDSTGPLFGSGVSLWAVGLYLMSEPRVAPTWVRITGVIAGTLFLIVGVRLFMGAALTPLTQPLPSLAYPFLVVTLFGWAWKRYRTHL